LWHSRRSKELKIKIENLTEEKIVQKQFKFLISNYYLDLEDIFIFKIYLDF